MVEFKSGDLVFCYDEDLGIPKIGAITVVEEDEKTFDTVYLDYQKIDEFTREDENGDPILEGGYPYFTDTDIVLKLEDAKLLRILCGVDPQEKRHGV